MQVNQVPSPQAVQVPDNKPSFQMPFTDGDFEYVIYICYINMYKL